MNPRRPPHPRREPRSSSSRSTPSGSSPSTRSRRRRAAIPACRWAWPTPRSCCGRGSCATSRRIPTWPDRDRFVLSAGHGSMLLYALLHLAGLRPAARGAQALPPARQQDARASRARPHARRRDHDRPARPGLRQRRRHGDRARRCSPRASTAPSSRRSTYRVFGIVSDGDLMEGVAVRGGVARRPLGARQPDLPLRRQPHHDRGRHRARVQRGRRASASRPTAGTCDRADADDHAGARDARSTRAVAETERPSLIITRSHIGYGAPHKQDTREAHGEPLGADEVGGHQARARLARVAAVPRARRGARAVRASAPRRCAREYERVADAA